MDAVRKWAEKESKRTGMHADVLASWARPKLPQLDSDI